MKRICHILTVLLLLHTSGAFTQPRATITTNISHTAPLVGTPVKVTIAVKGGNIKVVSWKLLDRVFKGNDLFGTNDTMFTEGNVSLYKHTVTFTAVTPVKFTPKPFSITVQYNNGTSDTLTSRLSPINFKEDIKLSSVHQIKPVAEPAFALSNLAGLLLILVIGIYIANRHLFSRPKPEISKKAICSDHLERVQRLRSSGLSAGMQADLGYRVLTDFLQYASATTYLSIHDVLPLLDEDDRRLLQDIVDMGDHLRFGLSMVDTAVVAAYLNQIKVFISQFHSLKFAPLYE